MVDSSSVSLTFSAEKQLNKGRRRKINVSEWKDNKRKMLRDAGKAYTPSKGGFVPAKIAPDNNRICRCNYECNKFSLEHKHQLYEDFYSVNYNSQTILLTQYMNIVEIKRRYVQEGTSRRNCSVKYYLPVVGSNKRVCQKTLCQVLKVTPRRLQKLQEKLKFNEPLNDKRGKHKTRPNALTSTLKAAIKEHINLFPKEESHYSRNNTMKLILHQDLSIKKMYLMFKNKYPNLKCSEKTYRDIFRSDFNLRFGSPRADTCALCDRLYVQLVSATSEEEINKISVENKVHHARAEKAYSILHNDTLFAKNNPNTVVLCTDLQQVLFCTTLKHSNIFYQRQYACYNQAIHNMGTNEVFMCLWHETVAKRGSAEISSCLLKYITVHFEPLKNSMERKLIVWFDRCVGQNNNWRTIALYQYVITLDYFTSVEQKFLVSGHSFLPCDRDFALIERKKKTAMIYHPKECVELIANARQSQPFHVCYMEKNDFKDLSLIETSLYKGDTKITESVWYKITSDDLTTWRSRISHNILQPWASHSLAKKSKGVQNRFIKPVHIELTTLPNLYNTSVPIKKEKKKNLLDMCRYIPNQEYRDFYQNLPTAAT